MQMQLELFQAMSGQPSARVIIDGASIRHLHSSVKPEEESLYFSALAPHASTIIACGTGLGYHLTTFAGQIPSGSTLILIDFFDDCLSASITTLRPLLKPEVHIVTLSSSSDIAGNQELSDLNLSNQETTVQIIRHPASYALNHAFYDGILSQLLRPQPKPALKKNRPLLLMGTFFLQPELYRALEEMSTTPPATFDYGRPRTPLEYETALHETLQIVRPTVIISVNMKGFDGNGILPTLAGIYSIPIVVWFVDDPHPILLHQGRYVNDTMFAATWEREYLPMLEKSGFSKAFYLPLAADPTLFTRLAAQKPTFPVGFVGSSMGESFFEELRNKFLWDPRLEPIVVECARHLLDHRRADIDHLVDMRCQEKGITLPFSDVRNRTWLRAYIIHYATMCKRRLLIDGLAPIEFHCFGDPEGWQQLVGSRVIVHPSFDYQTKIAQTYRSIAVTINTTSCQMPTAVNQRVFDAPMAGSFIISDNQETIPELFEPGREAVTYASVEELRHLIDYYRSHDDPRTRVSARARTRILSCHTYRHRLETLFEKIGIPK